MILTVPAAPSAMYSRATDRARGEVGVALGASVARALPQREHDDRASDIYHRVSAALHKGSKDDGTFASPDAVGRTLEVLNSLPANVPLPEVVVESDSEIGLDWDLGNHRVISLTVRDNPMVGFAAFFGAEPLYGRMPFVGEVPTTLRFLLSRLFAPSSPR